MKQNVNLQDYIQNKNYSKALEIFSVLNKSLRYQSLKYKNDFMITVAEKETKFKYNLYVPEGYNKDYMKTKEDSLPNEDIIIKKRRVIYEY